MLHLAKQALRSGVLAPNDISDGAPGSHWSAVEVVHQNRIVDDRRRLRLHAIRVLVADHADHFAPGIFEIGGDLFSDAKSGVPPQFAGQIFRHHSDRTVIVCVGPGELASRYQAIAKRSEKPGGDEYLSAQGRHLLIHLVPRVNLIIAAAWLGWKERGDSRRGHARNLSDPVENCLLH